MARTRLRPSPGRVRPGSGRRDRAAPRSAADRAAAMPDAGVRDLDANGIAVARPADRHPPPDGVYLMALSTRLASTWRSRSRSPRDVSPARRPWRRRSVCLRRRPRRRLTTSRDQRPASRSRSSARRMVPVSASEMSISVSSIARIARIPRGRSTAPRAVPAAGSARSGERPLGQAAQPRHRRAQIVRDVVERAAHAVDQRADPIEHRG